MAVPSPLFLLLAAFICSMIGRAYLIRAAMEISKGWGFAVMFVPFAPYFFRRNYKELAHEGRGWLTGATICGVLFFTVTGSTGSLSQLWTLVPDQFRPEFAKDHTEFLEEAPVTEPKPAVAVVPATPVAPTYEERFAANKREFARLDEVYESLRRERGYLRKHDDESIRVYNAAAAKYQADVAKARAEQTELGKLLAKK